MSHWESIKEQLPVPIKYKLDFCLVDRRPLARRPPASWVSSEPMLGGVIPIVYNPKPKQG